MTPRAAPKPQLGRCPDCGEVVVIEVSKGEPAGIPLHGCRSRDCVAPRCGAKGFVEEMAEFPSGDWYCPNHALLAVARGLLSIYLAEGETDWTAISEILGEVLPEVIAKCEMR